MLTHLELKWPNDAKCGNWGEKRMKGGPGGSRGVQGGRAAAVHTGAAGKIACARARVSRPASAFFVCFSFLLF